MSLQTVVKWLEECIVYSMQINMTTNYKGQVQQKVASFSLLSKENNKKFAEALFSLFLLYCL